MEYTSTKIDVGDRVRDRLTGFTGIAVCRSTWLNQCVRITVTSQETPKPGEKMSEFCFDEEQLELLEKGALVYKKKQTGGPQPNEALAISRR